MHTKASNTVSFLKLLSILHFYLPLKGHFIIKELKNWDKEKKNLCNGQMPPMGLGFLFTLSTVTHEVTPVSLTSSVSQR